MSHEDPLTTTVSFRFVVLEGRREWLRDALYRARTIFNWAIELRQKGYTETEINKRVKPDNFILNNKNAVVRKALETYNSYTSLREKYFEKIEEKDSVNEGCPSPPSTEKTCRYPLVMNRGEGYKLGVDGDGRVFGQISVKPYKQKIRGLLRGNKQQLDRLKHAIDSEHYTVGRAELVSGGDVYYLHVDVTKDKSEVSSPEASETVVGVDINEGNVAVTALDRETLDIKGTLVVDYNDVKNYRSYLHDVTRRCQEAGKDSMYCWISDKEERYTDYVLHRLSRVIVDFSIQFSDPVVVFEDMGGIRDEIEYGCYMNRRLHKLPFHKLERYIQYKSHMEEIPYVEVDSWYNSKRCGCCGELGRRDGGRFVCNNSDCELEMDHSDRNASINIAWRYIAKLDLKIDVELEEDDGYNDCLNKYSDRKNSYRTGKTPPMVRKVSWKGSGRVNRPASTRQVARKGVVG